MLLCKINDKEGVLRKKVLLEVSQNSQEKICARVEKRLWHRCFPVNFEKFPRRYYLQNTSGRLLLNLGLFLELYKTINLPAMMYKKAIFIWRFGIRINNLIKSFQSARKSVSER